jgi:hypothetical protein
MCQSLHSVFYARDGGGRPEAARSAKSAIPGCLTAEKRRWAMPRDIEELAKRAQYLRVAWRKANNYHLSLTRSFIETKPLIDTGVFGPEWTFNKWLIFKAGLSEQIIEMIRAMQSEETPGPTKILMQEDWKVILQAVNSRAYNIARGISRRAQVDTQPNNADARAIEQLRELSRYPAEKAGCPDQAFKKIDAL